MSAEIEETSNEYGPKSGEAEFCEATCSQARFVEGGKIKVSGRWYVIESIDKEAQRVDGVWDMWISAGESGSCYINEAFIEGYIPPCESLEDRYVKALELLDRHRRWCLHSEWSPGGRYHDSRLATETEKILSENAEVKNEP